VIAPDAPETVALRLTYRSPMDVGATLGFLGRRAIPHVELHEPDRFTRVLRAPGGPALISLSAADSAVDCRISLTDRRDLDTVVTLVRRLLDLDADPNAVDDRLGCDPM
jgi:AraC family transcriptional regulator, regulatory protein of adaptative response / DNA-3-methyladenine glycosylase II